jgi:hypothetical protein
MSDESWEQLEERLAAAGLGAPAALRAAVLGDVRRELRASRWDRRLARTAAAVMLLGVGWNALNVAIDGRGDLRAGPGTERVVVAEVRQDALVQMAATVAEATDAETGRRVARQLAMLGGRELSGEQNAAIDAALREGSGFRVQGSGASSEPVNGKNG